MLDALINTFVFISSFLVVLGFLVFFHELGHYSVARFFKVDIERFSVGFGKPIFGWTNKNGTKWSVGRIPLGGYVKFTGDAGAASNPDTEQLEALKDKYGDETDSGLKNIFHFKPLYQRALIVLAGPIANFILAVFLYAMIAMAIGTPKETPSETTASAPIIGSVIPNDPADKAGMKPGDRVLRLDGKEMANWTEMGTYISLRSGTDVEVELERGGQIIELIVRPERKERKDFIGGKVSAGMIGIGGQGTGYDRQGPVDAFGYGVDQTWHVISATGTYIGRIFQGKEDITQLGSVLRIGAMTGKASVDIVNADASVAARSKGLLHTLLQLAAAISIALGVANLMPIPALDGGHLLYYGYEAVAGRPLSQEKQEFGFRIGFALLLTLFVILTINDIGYVRSLFS